MTQEEQHGYEKQSETVGFLDMIQTLQPRSVNVSMKASLNGGLSFGSHLTDNVTIKHICEYIEFWLTNVFDVKLSLLIFYFFMLTKLIIFRGADCF